MQQEFAHENRFAVDTITRLEEKDHQLNGDDMLLHPLDYYAPVKINFSSDIAGEAFRNPVEGYNIIRWLKLHLRTHLVGLSKFTAWCKKR